MTPTRVNVLSDLHQLIRQRGDEQYTGEPVSHLSHALQCALLARRAGAGPALVAAALLHDVGHLLSGLAGTPSAQGRDDRHEELGALALARWFGPDVTEPVRLHVQAKRVLAARPAYARALSEDSQRSLVLQGGPMDAPGCARFLALPYAQDALSLRRWDDAAKKPGRDRWTLEEAWALVRSAASHG